MRGINEYKEAKRLHLRRKTARKNQCVEEAERRSLESLDEFADTMTDLGRDANAMVQGVTAMTEAMDKLKAATHVRQKLDRPRMSSGPRMRLKAPGRRLRTPQRTPRSLFKTASSTRLKICKPPWRKRKQKPNKRRRQRQARKAWKRAGEKQSTRCKRTWRWPRSRRNCGKPKPRKRRKMRSNRRKVVGDVAASARRKRITTPPASRARR